MGDGLGQGHALQCQLPGGLPERNGGFGKARSREVMGQHLGFGGLDVREALFDHACDLAVQLLSTAFEQEYRRRRPAPARA